MTRDEILTNYHNEHKYCPKCYSLGHKTTFIGVVLNMSEPERYRDFNICECSVCKHKHTVHDRVNRNVKLEGFLNQTGNDLEKIIKKSEQL